MNEDDTGAYFEALYHTIAAFEVHHPRTPGMRTSAGS